MIKDLSVQLLILELRVRFYFILKKKKRKREMSLIPVSHIITTVDTDSFIKGWREDPNILRTKLM